MVVILAGGGEYYYLNYFQKQVESSVEISPSMQNNVTDNWEIYNNSDPTYGFSIKYPKGYYLKSLETPLRDLANEDKEATNYETSQAVYLAISYKKGEMSESFDIIPGAKIFITIDIPKILQYECLDSCNTLNDWVDKMRKDITLFETIGKEEIQIGRAKGIIVYSQDKEITKTFRMVNMDVYLNQDDLYISLSGITSQNVNDPKTDANFKKMLQIIETFRFNQ